MGPIEQELRRVCEVPMALGLWSLRVSDEALDFCLGAAEGMGIEPIFLGMSRYDADVLSEAIEAAEALGL
jgi:hypothetical protein